MPKDFINAFQWPPQLPEIKDSLLRAYDTKQWGKYDGENCQVLSSKLSEMLELDFVRLCSSGTIATEIALRAVGVKAQDHVVLAGYDFPGNFRSIENVGALPVLADVKKDTWCIDPESIRKAVTDQTKAIIVSYLHGGVTDIKAIVAFANANNIRVIEDICQCPGADVDGDLTLGTTGDVCVLSFGGSKLLSAGRGGAMVTGDETIFQRAKIFCERGNDAFPLSELQAAVLIPQLSLLKEFREKRRAAFDWLRAAIASTGELATLVGETSDFFKVPFRWNCQGNKQLLISELRSQGILIDHGFPGFVGRSAKRCLSPVPLEHSALAVDSTLVLHHPCLLSDQFHSIVEKIIQVAKAYGSLS